MIKLPENKKTKFIDFHIFLPENEKRKFIYGTLPNKLKYIIVEDPSDDTTNVSLCVKAGSLMDPREYMGMAHFLEHMLFLGSKKYPEESYFNKILNNNGGMANAHTTLFETVYYFSAINNIDILLDIFSRFFIDPLFNINSVEREINAINSEHMKNLSNDMWATRQIIYTLANKDSSINRFTTGNFNTLQSNNIKKLREEMIKFYNSYYCSDNMYLTIISKNDVKKTEKYIKEYFSSIPVKTSYNIKNYNINITNYNIKNEEYTMIPTSLSSNIIYFWEVDTFEKFLLNKAINIISDVIENDSINNLQNVLKKAGLANSISTNYMEEGLFIIIISLATNISATNIKNQIIQINNIVENYMNVFLQKQVDWRTYYKYCMDKYNINYMYGAKIDNSDLVNILSENMSNYNIVNAYCGNMVVLELDMKLLLATVKKLNFSNCNIIYSTHEKIKVIKKMIEPYYLKKYGRIKDKLIQYSKSGINQYNFEILIDMNIIKKFNSKKPVVIKDLEQYNIPTMIQPDIWYGACDQFNEMNVSGIFFIYKKKWVSSVFNFIVTSIACSLLNQYIRETHVTMNDLGFSASFSLCNVTGYITFVVNGYNNMYNNYFTTIIDLNKIKIDPVILRITIDKLKQNIINIDKLSPWDYTTYILGLIQYRYSYENKDKLKAIEILLGDTNTNTNTNTIGVIPDSPQSLIHIIHKRIKNITSIFTKKITKKSKIAVTSFIYGNINKNNIPLINSEYKMKKFKKPNPIISTSINHMNKSDKNKVVLMMLPCGKYNPRMMATIIILTMLMEEPAFNKLRTEEQLGYMVKCSTYYNNYIYYIILQIQSTLDIDMVEKKMLLFIKYIIEYLETLDINIFNNIKKAAYNMLLQKPTNMNELIDKYINEIKYRTYNFNKNIIIANYINMIYIDNIKKLYSDIIKNIITIKIV